jgi:hypothetical protein
LIDSFVTKATVDPGPVNQLVDVFGEIGTRIEGLKGA